MVDENFLIGKEYSTSDIRKIKGESYLPSDYCYNSYCINSQWDRQQKFLFEKLERGKYKYLGKDYQYTGKVFDKNNNLYGSWNNGVFIRNNDYILINLIKKYIEYKKTSKYNEQYKYDYFAKNINTFNNLNNLSEKIIQLGSPNFVPYVWKSSMFRHLAFKHSFKFSRILENLFSETLPIDNRIATFRNEIKEILLNDSEWNNKEMIDPSVESASFFLSLKYPDKYLLFTRIKPYTNFSKNFNLDLEKSKNEDRYIAWNNFAKNSLIPLLNKHMHYNCNLLDCQDFIWFVFNQNKGNNMNLKEKFIKYVYDVVYKSNQSYTQYGKKIETLDNIILNLTNKQIYEIQTVEELSSFLSQLKNKNEWQKYNQINGNGIPYAILNTHYRNFIQNNIETNNIMDQETNFLNKKVCQPLNQILYGPPGTGKTYNTVLKAMSIIDNTEYKDVPDEKYSELKDRFDKLKQEGQIEFVTFHQSYSYEEFVEGIKPNLNSEKLNYQLENGIFKQICEQAKPIVTTASRKKPIDFSNTKVFKMSLGNTLEKEYDIYNYCIENNVVSLGWKDVDFSNCKTSQDFKNLDDSWGAIALERFVKWMDIGDIIIISNGNRNFRAIAQVKSDYIYDKNTPISHTHFRKVEWLYKGEDIHYSKINDKIFSQQSIYGYFASSKKGQQDYNPDLKIDELNKIITGKTNKEEPKPYILIIDEINRGDVSKIFGELITLIEKDKRIGKKYSMTTTLPYSKEQFGVPKNLYIIGTMNTADRSIALLDTALRRRFDFEEIMPKPELLSGRIVSKINLEQLLRKINERITEKYDRDHQIGHSYLMDVKNEKDLERAYKNNILPLLNEYFYNDTKTVSQILNCSENELQSNFLEVLNRAQNS